MHRENEQLLSSQEAPDFLEHEDQTHEVRVGKHTKKHGIWCRILTTLHLKKKSSGHEKLLSESQMHLTVPADIPSDEKHKTNKYNNNKSKSKSKKKHKTNSSLKSQLNNNTNNNVSASKYETLSNDFGHSCEKLNHPVTEIVPVDDNRETKEYFDISVKRDVHEYSDDRFGQCEFAGPDDDDLIERPRTDSQTTGQYIRHQWHGKRAKKARKRIRRAVRTTWLSLQTGTTVNNMMPNATNVSAAVGLYQRR